VWIHPSVGARGTGVFATVWRSCPGAGEPGASVDMRRRIPDERLRVDGGSTSTSSAGILSTMADNTSPDASPATSTAPSSSQITDDKAKAIGGLAIMGAIAAVSIGAGIGCAVHGYRRSGGSAGDAFVWGLAGATWSIVTPIVALAQGFGKPLCPQPQASQMMARLLDPHARARALLGS
jgi:hypothetical protein